MCYSTLMKGRKVLQEQALCATCAGQVNSGNGAYPTMFTTSNPAFEKKTKSVSNSTEHFKSFLITTELK